MQNIKFNYLYRDNCNYKKYGFVILANPNNLELQEFEKLIQTKLIDNQWFYANEWGVRELFFDWVDFRIDPTWHEFENVESSDEPSNCTLILENIYRSKIGLPEGQKEELDKRLKRFENGETTFFTWEEIKDELASRDQSNPPHIHPFNTPTAISSFLVRKINTKAFTLKK